MRKYILYGAGEYGLKAVEYFGKDRILCFVDKYVSGSVEGINIISPDELINYQRNNGGEIVVTPQHMSVIIEIALFLKEIGAHYRLLKDAAHDLIDEDATKYNELNKRKKFYINAEEMWYCTQDRMNPAGELGPYMWQDLWAARHIYRNQPAIHYDIGSRIDGFITHLMLWGQKVKLIDIRPMKSLEGIDFIQADATNLTGIEDGSIASLSALCSLEHFGLGRYGDPIDPDGCFKAFEAIEKKLASGGEAFIAVPVGREHVEFNAHRVFNAHTIIEAFGKCELLEYSAALYDRIEYNINMMIYQKMGVGCLGYFV